MKAEKAKMADNLRPCPFRSSSDHLELVSVDWVAPPMWGMQCVECNVTARTQIVAAVHVRMKAKVFHARSS
jgi:hypothetical protein